LHLADLMIVCPRRKRGTLPPERSCPRQSLSLLISETTKRSFCMGLLRIYENPREK
jgi:hypothetical protein